MWKKKLENVWCVTYIFFRCDLHLIKKFLICNLLPPPKKKKQLSELRFLLKQKSELHFFL